MKEDNHIIELYREFLNKSRESKAALRNHSKTKVSASVQPDVPFSMVDKIMEDPVVRGAMRWKIDKTFERGYEILDDDWNRDKSLRERLQNEFDWEENFLRPLAYMLHVYSNAFCEVIRGEASNKVLGVNVVNTRDIKPVLTSTGKIKQFVDKNYDKEEKGETPTIWKPEEMFWVKQIDNYTGFSPIDEESIINSVYAKQRALSFINWLFKTGQFRNVHSIGKGSDKEEFRTVLRRTADYSTPLVVKSNDKDLYKPSTLRKVDEIRGFSEVIEMFDRQILIALRVPPITAGIPESSGRSNSDTMTEEAMTHIDSTKNVIANAVNNQLFDRMNKGNNRFVWQPSDRKQESHVIDKLMTLTNAGLTPEAKQEFLARRGIIFNNTPFKEEQDDNESTRTTSSKDIDAMPSRFSDTESSSDSIGTGYDSTTRQEQLE